MPSVSEKQNCMTELLKKSKVDFEISKKIEIFENFQNRKSRFQIFENPKFQNSKKRKFRKIFLKIFHWKSY